MDAYKKTLKFKFEKARCSLGTLNEWAHLNKIFCLLLQHCQQAKDTKRSGAPTTFRLYFDVVCC